MGLVLFKKVNGLGEASKTFLEVNKMGGWEGLWIKRGGGGKSGFRDSEMKIDLFGLTSLLLNS